MEASRIRVLSSAVVDRIAAGEVVARPASVVKELIENSLDAGATRIELRIEHGGRGLVEVSDDGHGMNPDDARLAFVQHATSKISDIEDIERIATLGFRGEALASVAAVARVEMVTGTGEGVASRVRVEGSGEVGVEPVAAPAGTRIQVRDLFFNTPARRKHLRTDATELAQLAAVVQEFALLRPDVHFHLVADGRERLVAPPVAGLEPRVHQVLGREVAEAWVAVGDSGGRVQIVGGVTAPEHTRANRRQIHLFVNGRVIADGRLVHAVISAFGTLLDHRRYPVAALFLSLPAEDVDVNVHPRKAEVRFVEPGRVYGALRRAVQGALAADLPPPRLQPLATQGERPAPSVALGTVASLPLREWRVTDGQAPDYRPVASPGGIGESQSVPISGTSGNIQPLGQYANTYILAADEEGLLIIDQHVAHERILYEQILVARSRNSVTVQRLLVPETIDLSASEAAAAEANVELLAQFGFEIEPFGGATWAVRAVPELLGNRAAERAVRALLASLTAETGSDAAAALEREIAASIACHSAVRANQPLTAAAMAQLITDLAVCEAPNRCPHGRPIMLRLEHAAIERLLKRH